MDQSLDLHEAIKSTRIEVSHLTDEEGVVSVGYYNFETPKNSGSRQA